MSSSKSVPIRAKRNGSSGRTARQLLGAHPTRHRACVLAVGGLDPGGGAGILADARAIRVAGAFACAAVSLLTVQSTSGLRTVTPIAAREMIAECTEVLITQRVRAIKIGALGNEQNARAIGKLLAAHANVPTVLDTVIAPTRGRARLLAARAVLALRDHVLPRALLVTANAPEAAALTGRSVTSLDEAREAALALLALGPRSVLLKGGHLGGAEAVDLLVLRRSEGAPRVIALSKPRLRLASPTHGGGCVLASLIAGKLATSADPNDPRALLVAVRWAKQKHHAALRDAVDVGGDMRVLFA